MNEVLKIVLSLSLSGTILILVLLLARPLLKERLSKRWQYYIWLVVIARLLIPLAPETNLVGTFFQGIDGKTEQVNDLPEIAPALTIETPENVSVTEKHFHDPDLYARQSGRTGVSVKEKHFHDPDLYARQSGRTGVSVTDGQKISQDTEPSTPAPTSEHSVLPAFPWENLWGIWLALASILLIRKITIYQSFINYIRAGCSEVKDINLLERLGKIVDSMKIRGPIELYTNNLIATPLLIGFLRPCIILPTTDLSASEFDYIVLHELTHCKRGDMFYKWLVQLTTCLHWFNPFVYLIDREVSRTCELSCDETVIGKLDPQGRRAYGDTLLNAIVAGGNYKNSLASVTLNESKILLKERLNAIMSFKRKSRLCTSISVVLVFILCFGAMAAGAYAAPSAIGKNSVYRPEQQNPSIPSSAEDNNLTLVTKEYSIADIKALAISGVVVEAISENISITRSGDSLQVKYYIQNQNDYTLQNELDGGGTFEELVLRRVTPAATDAPRSISITIPDNINFKVISATTSRGNISLKNCSGENVFSETQSGDIVINGGYASSLFKVETQSGNALITDTDFPKKQFYLATKSGRITFQPKDSVQYYCFAIDTGADAQISINSKKYKGGDYEVNANAANRVSFDSPNGSLIVQDLNQGKLSIAASDMPPNTKEEARLLKPVSNADFTLVKKEYTEKELKKSGITGIRIEAAGENIVVNQKGTALILQYSQANSSDYTLGTRKYELYHGEFSTPEDIAMYGGKSGTVKEIELRRESPLTASDTMRTIYITLPADPKYSRVVQLFSDSGDIQINQCSSTAMLDASTQSGSISIQNCTSPLLGAETRSGDIDISGCSMEVLNSQTRNGTLSLQLTEKAENYKMTIDTGSEAKISINRKVYQGGAYVLNELASNNIFFDCKDGSLIITETAVK